MKGHTYQRGKTWTYVIDAGKDIITGKRIQKTKGGFRTKGDCQKAMDLEKYKITHDENYHGNYVNQNIARSVKDCINIYIESKQSDLKYTTIQTRKSLFKHLEIIYHLNIRQVTMSDIQHVFERTSFNHRTKRSFVDVLRSFFNFCKKEKWVDVNILSGYVVPKQKQTLEDIEKDKVTNLFYERDEIQTILSYLDKIKIQNHVVFQDCLIIKFAIFTGMRIGEILALEWKDIDINRGKIRVYKTINNVIKMQQYYNLTTPKTESSVRNISITNSIIKDLLKHLDCINNLKKSSTWISDHDFVFVDMNLKNKKNVNGLPYQYKKFLARYTKIIQNTSCRYLSPHKLRHTHCSLLAQKYVPLHIISARLGHSKTDAITQKVYFHVTKELEDKIAVEFDSMVLN